MPQTKMGHKVPKQNCVVDLNPFVWYTKYKVKLH